jgi:hypothetical protein
MPETEARPRVTTRREASVPRYGTQAPRNRIGSLRVESRFSLISLGFLVFAFEA